MTKYYELAQINWDSDKRDALAKVVSNEGLDIELIASDGFTSETYRKFAIGSDGKKLAGDDSMLVWTREAWPSSVIFDYLITLDNVRVSNYEDGESA